MGLIPVLEQPSLNKRINVKDRRGPQRVLTVNSLVIAGTATGIEQAVWFAPMIGHRLRGVCRNLITVIVEKGRTQLIDRGDGPVHQ